MQPVVLYDGDCALCRQLAAWIERKSEGKFTVKSSQLDAPGQPADRLRVKTASGLIEGVAAWEFLLSEVNELKGVAWLAGRLGLTRQTAAVLSELGYVARRLCLRCPRR